MDIAIVWAFHCLFCHLSMPIMSCVQSDDACQHNIKSINSGGTMQCTCQSSIIVLGILPLEETDMTSSACMPISLTLFMFALGVMTLV
jgi:hypothetical protein